MLTRMEEVRAQVAERDELIEIIAIALLTRKNVFILGDTGQAKSAVINLFRAGITGTNQFERLMSKQTDEEALFGRLDLSSLIPGGVPEEVLEKDQHYGDAAECLDALEQQKELSGDEYNAARNMFLEFLRFCVDMEIIEDFDKERFGEYLGELRTGRD